MPTASVVLFKDLAEQVGKGVHNFSAHSFKIALTNSAPNAATATVLADITQISTGGGYTAGAGGGIALTGTSYTETGGVGTLSFTTPLSFTASGGSVGPWRYAVIYNDTASGDPLVGYLDYGSNETLSDGESISFSAASGYLTVTV